MFSKNDIHVTGYPGGEKDKNFKHLWTMANKAKSIEGEKIRYLIPTAGGNSGSPVWLTIVTDEGNKPVVVGIHTHGESKLGSGNSGVRLTENKFKRLVEWINDSKGIEKKSVGEELKFGIGMQVANRIPAGSRFSGYPNQNAANDEEAPLQIDAFGQNSERVGVNRKDLEELLKDATVKNINTEVDQHRRRLLHLAVLTGDIILVREALSKNADLSMVDASRKTALHYACDYCRDEIVQVLLVDRADCASLTDEDGYPALYYAARQLEGIRFSLNNKGFRAKRIVDLLISAIGLKYTSREGLSPVHLAVKWGNVHLVKLLIEKGFSPLARDSQGKTPLHYAAELNDVESCHLLLSFGATLFSMDNSGKTPIFEACSRRSTDVVVAMLNFARRFVNNKEIVLEDIQKKEFVRCFLQSAPLEDIRLLRSVDRSLDEEKFLKKMQHTSRKLPIRPVSDEEVEKRMQNLIGHEGTNIEIFRILTLLAVNMCNEYEETPLHASVRVNDFDSSHLLIVYNEYLNDLIETGKLAIDSADPEDKMGPTELVNERNWQGNIPIFLTSDERVFCLLYEHGSKFGGKNYLGQEILHCVVASGLLDACKRLLQDGILVKCSQLYDKDKHTPLHLAALNNYSKICKEIIQGAIFVPTQSQVCNNDTFSDLFSQSETDKKNEGLIKNYWDDNFTNVDNGITILSKIKEAQLSKVLLQKILQIIYNYTISELSRLVQEIRRLELSPEIKVLLDPQKIDEEFGVMIRKHIMLRIGLKGE